MHTGCAVLGCAGLGWAGPLQVFVTLKHRIFPASQSPTAPHSTSNSPASPPHLLIGWVLHAPLSIAHTRLQHPRHALERQLYAPVAARVGLAESN